ncbi:hypothetical protein AHF37_03802 [Paragonimus kellicotti]|nr:hypothetical protein AHF37_03802 [Paragonimus kellicotti]
MSATLNADEISAYFNNCPKLHIPGRLFPVQTFFLEDVLRMTWTASVLWTSTTFAYTISCLNGPILSVAPTFLLKVCSSEYAPSTRLIIVLTCTSGSETWLQYQADANLVFCQFCKAIRETIKQMRASNPHLFGESSHLVRIYPLHSQLAVSKQRGLFDPPPPGQRKVIVATNIAETREDSYSWRGIHSQDPTVEAIRKRKHMIREIVELLQLGPVSEFLANCMSPPDQKAVERTLHFLHEIQALNLSEDTSGTDHVHLSRQQRKLTTRQLRKQRKQMARNATKNANIIVISDDDDGGGKDPNSQPEPLPSKSSYIGLLGDNAPLSPLGEHLARLPMNPQLAKLLILGALFGCLNRL